MAEPIALIGLMSGTSLDGVDGVLTRFDPHGAPHALAHVHRPFEPALRDELLALNAAGHDELHRAALAANGVARAYADVVSALLSGLPAADRAQVIAIAAHGQTVRHQPGRHDATGYTVQLLNGALLAELTGLDVVCDFRSRDVAAGGQGAPLVPAFHAQVFQEAARAPQSDPDEPPDADGALGLVGGPASAVVNIGGISNITVLAPGRQVLGFDCGPGNALLDAWCHQHTGRRYDAEGAWAATGQPHAALLNAMLAEPYFSQPPPKSTGREMFNLPWLRAHLGRLAGPLPAAADVQATLSELTAQSIAQAGHAQTTGLQRLVVCGGGAFNTDLMRRLKSHCPGVQVLTSAHYGIPVDQVEAIAFAWLGLRFLQRLPGSLPAVTGAAGPRVLGTLYPGGG